MVVYGIWSNCRWGRKTEHVQSEGVSQGQSDKWRQKHVRARGTEWISMLHLYVYSVEYKVSFKIKPDKSLWVLHITYYNIPLVVCIDHKCCQLHLLWSAVDEIFICTPYTCRFLSQFNQPPVTPVALKMIPEPILMSPLCWMKMVSQVRLPWMMGGSHEWR